MAILAIDQGTTGTKAMVVNTKLKVIAEAYEPFKQHFPEPGWVEHDPKDIWNSVLKCIKNVGQKVSLKSIDAIGITNQRETVCFWDKRTGRSLARAIVWQDRRSAPLCAELKAKGHEEQVRQATGLVLDPYFSVTKVRWALDHLPAVQKAAEHHSLAVGTIDSFLIHRLTGGQSHVTEPSNASRTMAFHLQKLQWDFELSQLFQVSMDHWPEVRASFGFFGKTTGVPGLPDGIPITGVLGDQQSALLGQACLQPGEAKCTFGTGAFLLMNTGKQPVFSTHRLLTTIAWNQSPTEVTYALEGSAFVAGAAVQWIRDGLGLIKRSEQIETLAKSVKTSDGVVVVPALTGLGAPHWIPEARGLISGITRGTTAGHIARATLEGICFQNYDILNAMQKDLGRKLTRLAVDGGGSKDQLMMQFQSDILGTELVRPKNIQSTSLGAVFAAGLGAGIWTDLSVIRKVWTEDKRFSPLMKPSERRDLLAAWSLAVRRASLV